MDKSFIHVPVLRTADDLPAWRRAVRLLCLSHNVWGNVTGTGDNVRPDDPALVRLFLKDDRKAQAILQSTLDEDQLTWGIITKKLYREESRISRVTERVEAMVLIPVLGSSKPASKVLVRCDYCKKVGHLKARCWKYQKDLKLKRKNAKPPSAKDVALLVSEESVSASVEEEEF